MPRVRAFFSQTFCTFIQLWLESQRSGSDELYGLARRALWGQWGLGKEGWGPGLGRDAWQALAAWGITLLLDVDFHYAFLSMTCTKHSNKSRTLMKSDRWAFRVNVSPKSTRQAQGVHLLDTWVQLSCFITEWIKKLNPFLSKQAFCCIQPITVGGSHFSWKVHLIIKKLPALQLAHLFCSSKYFRWKFLSWKEEK